MPNINSIRPVVQKIWDFENIFVHFVARAKKFIVTKFHDHPTSSCRDIARLTCQIGLVELPMQERVTTRAYCQTTTAYGYKTPLSLLLSGETTGCQLTITY